MRRASLEPPSLSMLAQASQSQLLLIDTQAAFLAAMPVPVAESLLKQAAILLQAAQWLDIPLLFSEQYPQGLGATAPSLRQHLPADFVPITKTRFSCCGLDNFDRAIAARQRRQIVIAGVEAHVCVLQTAIQLQQQGYCPIVLEDAVASRQTAHKDNAIARLRQAGVVVSNVESTLFEWLEDASHSQFKRVSALIK